MKKKLNVNRRQLLLINRIPANVLKLSIACWLLATSIIGGALGYVLIEGYAWVDAFYMSIITLSTVGFGELEPLSASGRVFTSIFILFNTIVLAYVLAVFSYYIIEGKIFHSMYATSIRSKIDQLNDHIIICGYGRYGREVSRNLREQNQKFVVIDSDEDRLIEHAQADPTLLYLHGDATDDSVLEAAGIHRARGLISALNDDGDNMFIVLSARQLNPALRIVSRAKQVRSEAKLMQAGADHVIMPELMGGFYMATLMSRPQTVEFFRFMTRELNSDIGFETISYDDLKDENRNKCLSELHFRKQTGINIIGHHRIDGTYEVNPDPSARLLQGESFIALGTAKQLEKLREILGR
ncbi:MAG: potassium channel protein [Bacteroidota bacterium]